MRLDVVEDLDDARGAVRRQRVDVEVGATEPLRHGGAVVAVGAVRIASPGFGRRALGDHEVRPDREEDRPPLVGRRGDDPLEGARLGLEVAGHALARGARRRAPGWRRPGRGSGPAPVRRTAVDVDRRARSRRPAARARPAAAPARRRTRPSMPPPVRSRSPTSPTGSPARSAASSSRRASRSPTIRTPVAPRVRSNQAWRPGIVDRLHRHRDRQRATAARCTCAGSSMAPKCRPTKMTAAAPRWPRSTSVRRLDDHRGRPARRPVERRRPGHLEVVAGRVAERRAQQSLQGGRIRRPRPARAAWPGRSATSQRQTRSQVEPPLRARAGATPIPELAGASAAATSGPSGSRRQPAHSNRRRSAPIRAARRRRCAAATSRRRRRRSSVRRHAGHPARFRVGAAPAEPAGARPPRELVAAPRRCRPERLEAVPLVRARRRCSARARPRSPASRGRVSVGPVDVTRIGSSWVTKNVPSGRRRAAIGRIVAPVLRGEDGRPGRQRGPRAEQPDGDAVGRDSPNRRAAPASRLRFRIA